METKVRQGAVDGALIGILIILIQPFQPLKGLIPELMSFLTTVPLLLAAMIFKTRVTALVEGGVVLIYFIVVGSIIGAAFQRKSLWGWLLVIALAIHHYIIYDQFGRQMGEVIQTVLNLLV